MRRRWTWLFCALGLLGLGGAARADVVELVGGRAIQGKILEGQTGEDGLAVELFDTGGVIVVKWDHILPARAKELKVRTGLEVAEETEILVTAHRVLLTSGEVLEGLALNPDEKDKPLQLKTRTSVQQLERIRIARIDETQLPGLAIYAPDELYQKIRDENPPETAAAHLDLAVKCMHMGALSQAQSHLAAAKADAGFADTLEGKKIPALERQLDTLVKSKGAQDMVAQIRVAMRGNRWNEALAQLAALDTQYKDEQVRRLIRFDLLESSVVRGRDSFFRREVQKKVYFTMARLIDGKSREKKPLRDDPSQPRGVATPGTLAAARQWVSRDLPTQIWDKVMADLGLKPEEMDKYWKERSGKNPQTANYGTGSFIVVKRAAAPKSGQDPNRQRRPPGGAGQQPQGPQRQAKEDKPKTEEEWFEAVGPGDRARWLTAFFVESSGMFEIVRTDESQACEACGGRGVQVANNSDGTQSSSICPGCNGATKFRKVIYR
jgi:hypothetical protein